MDSDNNGKYESRLQCQWQVIGNDQMILTFNVTDMQIEGPTENDTAACPYDHIKVYDGPYSNSDPLRTLCGNSTPTIPITISGTGNSMYITFTSDSLNNMRGFTARIGNIARLCGSSSLIAGASSQTIQSPNYPNHYPPSIRCRWVISTPEETQQITIHVDDLNIQDSESCTADSLKFTQPTLNEDMNIQAGQAGNGSFPYWTTRHYESNYCGHNAPHTFDTRSNGIEIVFKTDAATNEAGFRLHYALTSCNATYSAHSGYIYTPSFPSGFCRTVFNGGEGWYVALYFSRFRFYSGQSLKIHDGSSPSSSVLMELSGYQTPQPVFSSGSSLLLEYTLPETRRRSMFALNYVLSNSPNGCGGNFYGRMSVLSSPNYPNNPASNLDCRYALSVPSGMRFMLSFTVFDFSSNGGCNSTYLELYNVDEESGEPTLYTTYCPGDQPSRHESETSRMILQYHTDDQPIIGQGWHAVARQGRRRA